VIDDGLRTFLLKDTDASVRYRAYRELLDRPEDDPGVLAARQEIGRTGWAAAILARQLPTGQWDSPGTSPDELYRPKYISTNFSLLVLADLGLTRETPGIAKAIDLLRGAEGSEKGGLGGSGSELCFTGNALRMMLRFGYAEDPTTRACLDWLVSAQKADGGWHCFPSETGTLDCWEALAAFALVPDHLRSPAVRRAIERGAEFYLARELLHEGEKPYPPWTRLHYPVHYYYDVLVGLDTLTRLGYGRDPRLRPALDLLESKRHADGTWSLDALHPDIAPEEEYQIQTPFYPFALESPGRPSRWITLTALTVLRRAGRG
jgi:hypothetical protein